MVPDGVTIKIYARIFAGGGGGGGGTQPKFG